MGKKSGWTGKYILYYLAFGCIIIAVNLAACAPVQDRIAAIRTEQQLAQYRENLAAGSSETVIQQAKLVLAENETEPPADLALYALGEVYAQPDYEGRDYALSQHYFEKLITNFPDSKLVPEAKTFISLFETIAAREKATLVSEKKKKAAAVKEKPADAARTRKVVENLNFAEALQKNMQILEKAGMKKPSDEALYNIGLIYAHVDNPAKDYKKSQTYFEVLAKQFPESDLAEEARIWLGLFETIDKIQQIDIEIEQQKKELTR